MALHSAVSDLVGRTPVVRLSRHSSGNLIAKLEGNNPTGSVFDRIAASQLGMARKQGFGDVSELIHASDTSALTVSWAWLAAVFGLGLTYERHAVVPDAVGRLLDAFGATETTRLLPSAKDIDIDHIALLEVGEGSVCYRGRSLRDGEWGVMAELWNEVGKGVSTVVLPAVANSFIDESVRYLDSAAPAVETSVAVLDGSTSYWPLVGTDSRVEASRLREKYAGISPVVSVSIEDALEEALLLARTEAILTDLESAAAVRVARLSHCRENKRLVATVLCSHGLWFLDDYYSAREAEADQPECYPIPDDVLAACSPTGFHLTKAK